MSSSLTLLKDHLRELSPKEKDDFILSLWKNPDAKRVIEKKLGLLDIQPLYEKAKKKIDQYIFGRSGVVLKKAEAKKAISEYKKETDDIRGTIRLMLYYVERMEAFTRSYGDIDGAFYTSAENTFFAALQLIDEVWWQREFSPEVTRIAERIIDFDYGWGFSDVIGEYFDDWKMRNKDMLDLQ